MKLEKIFDFQYLLSDLIISSDTIRYGKVFGFSRLFDENWFSCIQMLTMIQCNHHPTQQHSSIYQEEKECHSSRTQLALMQKSRSTTPWNDHHRRSPECIKHCSWTKTCENLIRLSPGNLVGKSKFLSLILIFSRESTIQYVGTCSHVRSGQFPSLGGFLRLFLPIYLVIISM